MSTEMKRHEALKALAEDTQINTGGTWTLQTGCSWRRIGNEFGDGNVLRPCIHQRDGWPDLSAAPFVLEYLVAAQPSAILELIADYEALLAERDALKAAVNRHEAAMAEVMRQVDGNIRETVRDCVNGANDVQDIYDYCDLIEEAVAAAMQGEQP